MKINIYNNIYLRIIKTDDLTANFTFQYFQNTLRLPWILVSSIQLEYVVMHHDALNSPVFGACCFFPQKCGQSHATCPIIPVGGKALGSTGTIFCSLMLCVQHELHQHETQIGWRYNQASYEQSLIPHVVQ